jgi:hypothetical protein
MFALGPPVALSFYTTKKGGEEVQTVVPLPATAFYIILNYMAALAHVIEGVRPHLARGFLWLAGWAGTL